MMPRSLMIRSRPDVLSSSTDLAVLGAKIGIDVLSRREGLGLAHKVCASGIKGSRVLGDVCTAVFALLREAKKRVGAFVI
jgi:hypothetical protein